MKHRHYFEHSHKMYSEPNFDGMKAPQGRRRCQKKRFRANLLWFAGAPAALRRRYSKGRDNPAHEHLLGPEAPKKCRAQRLGVHAGPFGTALCKTFGACWRTRVNYSVPSSLVLFLNDKHSFTAICPEKVCLRSSVGRHLSPGVGPRRLHGGDGGQRCVGQAVDGARSTRKDEAAGN